MEETPAIVWSWWVSPFVSIKHIVFSVLCLLSIYLFHICSVCGKTAHGVTGLPCASVQLLAFISYSFQIGLVLWREMREWGNGTVRVLILPSFLPFCIPSLYLNCIFLWRDASYRLPVYSGYGSPCALGTGDEAPACLFLPFCNISFWGQIFQTCK